MSSRHNEVDPFMARLKELKQFLNTQLRAAPPPSKNAELEQQTSSQRTLELLTENMNILKRRLNEDLNPESGNQTKKKKDDCAKLELLLLSSELEKLKALRAREEAETKQKAEESRALDCERKIKELEEAMATLKRTYEEKIKEFQAQIQQFQTKEAEMQELLQDARWQLSETQSELEKAQQIIKSMETTHSIEKKELANQLEEQTALYEAKLESLQGSCDELRGALNDKQIACAQLEERVNDRETGMDDSVHAQVDSLKADTAQLQELVLSAYMQIDETKRVATTIYRCLGQPGLDASANPATNEDNEVDREQQIRFVDEDHNNTEDAVENEKVDETQDVNDCGIDDEEKRSCEPN